MNLRAFAITLAAIIPIAPTGLQSQCGERILPQNHPTVAVDLASGTFSQKLPFDESFFIRIPLPERTDSIQFSYGEALLNDDGDYDFVVANNSPGSIVPNPFFPAKEVSVEIEPLKPKRQYLFRFIAYRTTIDSTLAPPVRTVTSGTMDVIGRTETSISNRLQTDFGVARSREAGYWGVVSNAHFYFVPVNKNADACVRQTPLMYLAKRISIFGGLSVLKIASEAEVEHLFGIGTPVVGIGARDLPYLGPIRLNAGVIWFEQDDANPLVTERVRKHDLFLSVTSDIELKGLLGPLFSIIK